jgi:hypothetical protein
MPAQYQARGAEVDIRGGIEAERVGAESSALLDASRAQQPLHRIQREPGLVDATLLVPAQVGGCAPLSPPPGPRDDSRVVRDASVALLEGSEVGDRDP